MSLLSLLLIPATAYGVAWVAAQLYFNRRYHV